MESLKRLRLETGMSQQDLAKKSGVGQDTISGIETGAHEPRPSTLRKLATALDVEVADFFREPVLPKAEAPEAGQGRGFRIRVQPSGEGPSVTREAFEERGIPVTDDEVRGVNLYLDGLHHGRKSGGPVITFGVEESANVHQKRVDMLAIYALRYILPPDEAEAIYQGVLAELVGGAAHS